MNDTKICTRCKKILPVSEFNKYYKNKNGLYSHCKQCNSEKGKEWRDNNKEYCQEKGKQYRARQYQENPQEFRKKLAEQSKKRYSLEKLREYRKNNPEKYKARRVVQSELRKGSLIRPNICFICGGGHRIEAHHCDYNKPLRITWVCAKCHRAVDRRMSNGTF